MAVSKRIRKNAVKQIGKICYVNKVSVFSLANNFISEEISVSPAKWPNRVKSELDTYKGASLHYNGNHCVLRIHSNLWYEWDV